jgi:hypothetical protein
MVKIINRLCNGALRLEYRLIVCVKVNRQPNTPYTLHPTPHTLHYGALRLE